jgi:hypothetical protein
LHVVLGECIAMIERNGGDAHGLIKVREKVPFTAPEVMRDRWMDAQVWLEQNFRGDVRPWVGELQSLWMGNR